MENGWFGWETKRHPQDVGIFFSCVETTFLPSEQTSLQTWGNFLEHGRKSIRRVRPNRTQRPAKSAKMAWCILALLLVASAAADHGAVDCQTGDMGEMHWFGAFFLMFFFFKGQEDNISEAMEDSRTCSLWPLVVVRGTFGLRACCHHKHGPWF